MTFNCSGRAATLLLFATIGAVDAAAQPIVPPPAPRPPIINRVNEALPSWLRLRGEFRERVEGFTGAGFTPDRDDLYALSRFRLSASLAPSRAIGVTIQVQDARVGLKDVGPTTAPFRAPFDLRAAFVDLGDTQKGTLSARLGRQELAFGEQRLVGHLNWTNAARTFDAARVTLRRGAITVDAFAASVVRSLPDRFDRSGSGNQFHGVYAAAAALVPQSVIEPFVFYRRDRNLATEAGPAGTLDQVTAGARWAGALPARFDYGIEIAGQTGSLGQDEIRAWASHWQLRHALPGPLAVRVAGEFNIASGDADPADGRRETFDQLYPTGHDKYGLADQIGWRNIRHVRGGVELRPGWGLTVGASYHSWWVAERRDGLYNAGGLQIARVAGGAAGSHVGQEIDLQAARAITPQIQIAGGYAYLRPGAFLREATPGVSYSAPYLMVTCVLLADR